MSVFPNNILANLGLDATFEERRALALAQFSGRVSSVFPYLTVFRDKVMKARVSSGDSHQFPYLSDMGYSEHEPGTLLAGQKRPITEDRRIVIDQKEIVASDWLNKPDDFIKHYSDLEMRADAAARSLSETVDSRCARMLAKGARQPARGLDGEEDFPSGVLYRVDNNTSLESAFPVSAAGSRIIQDALASVGQSFAERNISSTAFPWYAFVGPYLYRVLLRDNSLVSRDYVDPMTNNKVQTLVSMVENFTIIKTNQMPHTAGNFRNHGSNGVVTQGEAAYQGDFSRTAIVCMAAMDSVGMVDFSDVEAFGPTWKEEYRSWLYGAAFYAGIKWLRPSACAEIYWANSANEYVLNTTTNEFEPA